jgi:anti-sigma factor RsiW
MGQPEESERSADPDLACREFVALITGHLEGTLDAATARRVRDHLERCPDCETYLAQMRATIRALGHVPVESLTAGAKRALVTAFRDGTG